jgi:SAM-dependent methyltransferase
MEGYEASTYGDRWADVYDFWFTSIHQDELEDPSPLLAELAGAGPALELAIGTGRVAIPLAHRGVEVHGIDASGSMVDKLREKPGGADIPVTIGDFADVGVEGRYPLVFLVFNTLFALLTQEDQARCFKNVADHLSEDGVFVVEAFVPDLSRFDGDQRTETIDVELDRVFMETLRHDAAEQRVRAQLIELLPDGNRFYPVSLRYSWPSEIDLMARMAGLRLRERWSDWNRSPFDSSSGRHVSVYGR